MPRLASVPSQTTVAPYTECTDLRQQRQTQHEHAEADERERLGPVRVQAARVLVDDGGEQRVHADAQRAEPEQQQHEEEEQRPQRWRRHPRDRRRVRHERQRRACDGTTSSLVIRTEPGSGPAGADPKQAVPPEFYLRRKRGPLIILQVEFVKLEIGLASGSGPLILIPPLTRPVCKRWTTAGCPVAMCSRSPLCTFDQLLRENH